MDPLSKEQHSYSDGHVFTSATELSPFHSDDDDSSNLFEEEEAAAAEDEGEEKVELFSSSLATKPRGLELLLAPRSYSSNEEEKEQDEDIEKQLHDTLLPWAEDDEETRSIEEDIDEDDEDEDMNAASAVMAIGYGSFHNVPDVSCLHKQRHDYDPIDDLEVSLQSLQHVAQQKGLDTTALRCWSMKEDGKLLDPDHHEYRRLRDALRAYTYLLQGVIPREDIYYLAILRRKLAQMVLPLVDGPISVIALGHVVPEKHFYTSKRLFPIGYETLVKVQLSNPVPVAFRLRCKIVHGNKKKSPIFVVELENSAVEIVFRSYVASKAWKKALVHFESLSADDLMTLVCGSVVFVETDENGKSIDVLTPASSEDGFGLLRRSITRVLEGLHQVLLCRDYQFWEQRHSITPDVHAKIRSRLKGQLTDVLQAHTSFSKDEISHQLSQELLLEEHSHDADDVQRFKQQEEKEQREADKRSVRKAARKLLEIEMKAQADAKEAQQRAKEARKSAIIEAKMEAARQKEARKEALRLAKEEEKRMREEEKEIKRALREEEKRKKLEEKENSMKRRIDELRQRRQMLEEQKAILENGVVTSSSPRRFSDSRKRKAPPDAQSIRQQQLVLLKFVEEEKERRRQICLWEKRKEVEREVWARVKARYTLELQNRPSLSDDQYPQPHEYNILKNQDTKFPLQVISQAADLDAVPSDCQADLLFVWDFISTFSDCLKLPVLPSLSVFVKMMTLSDGSSPVGDGELDDDSIGTLFASLHAELLKVLITEYFPLLQMGTTIDEFYRTRPMNAFSWPELAREVCQFAMEFKRPSADEQLLKSIKGARSYRDDSVTHPLRQKLQRRGTNLLNGIQFEEVKEEPEAESSHETISNGLASDANYSSELSKYYGVVFVEGVFSRIKMEEKGQNLVVTEIIAKNISANNAGSSTATEQKEDSADRIRVGDYLLCVNGHDVRETSLDEFNCLLSKLQTPHGLLLSSIVPVVRNPMKHVATTQGATKMKRCGFVLKLLRAKEIAGPFNQPVDAELYPDYYSSGDITEPMDLGTISEKIEDEDYENDDVESFVDDIQLVWRNCYTYNSMKAEISNMAQKLSAIFERLMKEWVYTTANRPMAAAEEDNCRNCRTIHAKGQLLLCDRCDAPYHTFCLDPSLSDIPKREWFCLSCHANPSFLPEQFQKKIRDMANSSDNTGNCERNENDLTELEKQLLSAIDLLSQENYSKLTISDRLKVLRVLCELMEEASAVQSVYHSLHEKANDVRKKLGESLADLEREWDQFTPPHSSHGVEQTKKFIIDGVERELTDELLTYLEDKAKAELESRPIPVLPESARKKLCDDTNRVKEEPMALTTEDDPSDTSSVNNACDDVRGAVLSRPVCAFCGLEDGVLNGPLRSCKQSALTSHTTLLKHYELPELLIGGGAEMLTVRTLTTNDLATMLLEDTADGVQYSESSCDIPNYSLSQDELDSRQSQLESTKRVVYAINDRVVFGMSRAAIQDHLRAATQPVLLYLTVLPGEAVRASASIVKCHGLPLMLVLDGHESFIFVQSYRSSEDVPVGFGELSGQVFPGDVLLMVNGTLTRGKDVADIKMLFSTKSPVEPIYAVFVRPPSAKMRKADEEWQRVVHDAPSQRARKTAFRAGLITPQMGSYEVIFQDGPLGLALALETRGVVVKSLNDHPDGTLGQASMSGSILRGDLVERVNGASYGQLNDLSQFTSWLLSLPRPLKITFSRQPPGGGTPIVTPEEANKRLAELLSNPSLLYKQLKLPTFSDVKTYRVESFPLPFEVENFLEYLGVIAVKGLVYCEQYASSNKPDEKVSVSTVRIGDRIVGLNGKPVTGLSWATVNALCAEMSSTCPVYIHFTRFAKPMTLLQAHESCVESANVAWSECGSMLPRIEKARKMESFIKWSIVPRTLAFGKCRHGYSFYRFSCDHNRLFVLSPEKKWSLCATKDHLVQLLSYLDEDSRDAKIATQIRWCFHWVLHSESTRHRLRQGFTCCEYSSEDYIRDGPFSIKKKVLLAMDGDTEKYESMVGYHGRNFFLGSFHTQQEAERSLLRAETSICSTGFHTVVAADVTSLRDANFPLSIVAPYPKAKSVVKRLLSRKYEYGSAIDRYGEVKPIPISHDVYQLIKHSLRSDKAMLNCIHDVARSGVYQTGVPHVAVPRMQGDVQLPAYAAAQARYQDALKRKHTQIGDLYAHQSTEQSKRNRYADSNEAARKQQQFALGAPNNAVSFKRSLQALVDHGRSMLAVWNRFAASATVQTTNALAYACLSSFEAIKKVVSRIVVDPTATHPDSKTFVCLHHAYVMGLICAMATQALTTSQKTHSDSALVKQVADAFATAILSCVDPSNMLRARALSGFATAAKKCEPSQRAGDLSVELHNVANFVLMFLRTTQYLSGSSFDDLSICRPLFTPSTPGVESLPASFVQQINLLENIRQAFYRKINIASRGTIPGQNQPSLPIPAYRVMPGSTSMPRNLTSNPQTSNQASNNGTLVDVEFGYGPLGVVINYSNQGTIVVTEFSNDSNNMMGQAQASGKVQVGDEVYAVNGNKLEVLGMEGFKTAVATSKRPLQVTFRRMLPSSLGGAVQVQSSTFNMGYSANTTTQGTIPSAEVASAINHQAQQPSASNQPMTAGSMNSNGLYGNQQPRSEPMVMGSSNLNPGKGFQGANPEQFPGMGENINLLPFPSAPSSEQMGNPSLEYGNLQTAGNLSDFMGDMSGQTFPAVPSMCNTSYDTLPNAYTDDVASTASVQNTGGGWQHAPNPIISHSVPPGSVLNAMNVNESGNVQSMDSEPLLPNASSGMGYSSAPPPIAGAPVSYHSNSSTGEFLNFVAGNDSQLPPNGDPSQVNYYDANETTYRGTSDFDIDTSATTSNETTALTTERSTIADVDTEPESPSISQVTTPAQSDTDAERSEIERQRDREVQLARLQEASRGLQSSSADVSSTSERSRTNAQAQLAAAEASQTVTTVVVSTPTVSTSQSEQATVVIPEESPPLQTARASVHAQTGGKEPRVTDKTSVSRRSSRVSRKITNIADMYDPDFAKTHSKGGSEAGTEEPTDGEVGELATELLEAFGATIRPRKKDLPRSLLLLRAQLLTIESAIPRDAFRSGRWGRSIRAAWAEMVYACDTSAMLMEAVVFLEASIDPEWLDPSWKASPLPSAKNAITTATIASAAMRLYSLDDAISYGRMKRGGKRKQRNAPATANSSRPGVIQKTTIISQELNAAEPRERSLTIYAHRKARSEVAAITSLTEDQVERWIQASSAHQAQTSSAQLQSVSGRSAALKRKHPGPQLSGTSGQRSISSRKRRAQNLSNASTPMATPQETQYVELRCFQMKTPQHCFPMGSAQDVTLRSRLERIMDIVLRNELALAFSAPVNVNDVPGYANIIKHPMDLGTIRIRLSRGFYDQRFEMLVRDVNLVWENCFTFNRLDADISKCANRLRSIFNRLFEQWVTEVPPNTPVTHLASEELCRQCGQMNAQESMLLCDSCDAAYHAFCLQPPLTSIPPGNWYCPRCPIKKLSM
ncbi:unnamed protein product [Peronospora belbahrii]|uniref:Uncharacterized protein n=1 Tax=Peronospora belbahrii TaxID=622444 RepID=A0AAU9LPX9_9STRA|nr:unnamed protein product [Peronospora belbahrii]